jgi:predicted PurR-regulated permease PerM
MYFFLKDGRKVLDKMLYYLPLEPQDETRLARQFVSVARATIKGTLVIGLLQGVLGGLAFWVLGLDGAALWATVMAILSIIPGLGHGIVWIPTSIYLAARGDWGSAIGLFIWGAAVIGSVDNFLRPWLVGKDTEMPDLMILISTLGGLILFGPVGFIVGPIVAALFVTVWDLYGTAFEEVLPPVPEPPPSTMSLPKLAPDPEVPRTE